MTKISSFFKPFGLSFLSVSCVLSLATTPFAAASDHVDSPIITINPAYTTGVDANGKFISVPPSVRPQGKLEDITDVYVFREGDQSGNPADNSNLVFILTLNGLRPPGDTSPFGSDIDYVFKISPDKN